MQNLEMILNEMKTRYAISPIAVKPNFNDEIYLEVRPEDFYSACLALHILLVSPVMTMFAVDERKHSKQFIIYAGFVALKIRKWIFLELHIPQDDPTFNSIAKKIYSANLFEREIKEMFGFMPLDNPDNRRLNLHEEVWPEGFFPLRKDFDPAKVPVAAKPGEYQFTKVEGEGIFEVPVGPVHAGVIPPGHFRFSVAGEPIINLEIRLGFKHRGVEKTLEGKTPEEALKIAECVAGDSAFSHGLAFCRAIEKIRGIAVPERAEYWRAILLELERMYNHVADIGGIAVDVGLSFPAALASIIKETVQGLNGQLTGSRFLKNINCVGGLLKEPGEAQKQKLLSTLETVLKDFTRLRNILNNSASFQDRVETTGVLKKKVAEDFGVTGPAGRASGIAIDLRHDFPGLYQKLAFQMALKEKGDVRARLDVRFEEFQESARLVRDIISIIPAGGIKNEGKSHHETFGLGAAEGWRGPILYWVKLDRTDLIERCKVVDPSFHNWQGLSYAVQENIIPDFPVCNKSFNLSYSGNDL